jgi:hypothetical protein
MSGRFRFASPLSAWGLRVDNREAQGLLGLSILFNLHEKPICQFFALVRVAVQMTHSYRFSKQTLETGNLDQNVYGFHVHVLGYEKLLV